MARTPPCAMTPENLLRSMCERHGLPADYGERLIPLVRRAMAAPDEVRDRILALVDGNLAQHAAKDGNPCPVPTPDPDTEELHAVARVLHNWTPAEPRLDLGWNVGGEATPEAG